MPAALFNSENARAYGTKGGINSQAVQRAKRAARKALLDPAFQASEDRSFASEQLSYVRTMLKSLNIRLTKVLAQTVPDPEEVERLCRSAKALSEQECYLSGRPRPGIRRVSSRDSQVNQPLPPPSEPA